MQEENALDIRAMLSFPQLSRPHQSQTIYIEEGDHGTPDVIDSMILREILLPSDLIFLGSE